MAMASTDGIDVFDPTHLDDPYPMYRHLREHTPVYRLPGTDFHLVSSWELVAEATERVADFSSNLTGTLLQQSDGPPLTLDMDSARTGLHVLATADDPLHKAHRKFVSPVLAKRIRALGPTVAGLVDRLWTRELRDGRMDWATGMADQLPLALVADIIGLRAKDVPHMLG